MIKLGMIQKIKNMFRKTSKKTFGKLGLFLIFGMLFLNINLSLPGENYSIYSTVKAADNQLFITTLLGKLSKMGLYPKSDEDFVGRDSIMAVGNLLSNDPFEIVIKGLLLGVLEVLDIMLKSAGLLFNLVIDQDFFRSIIDNEGLYAGWVIVRDMLNLFFMLLLLFSAFATVFQVEKYHLRKVIIMLIVMALLVNFSFPITLFVIDFSNSAMYFLAENVNGSASIMKFTSFGANLKQVTSMENTISALILSCIFLFITFCTILAIALNLLIRILFFAILLVVSPVGFVFSFFPGTKSLADEWWSSLLKYAFMGPVMMFFLYLAVLMFTINSTVNYGELKGSLPANFVMYIVPTVFLWIGLFMSNRFGGTASGAAMNFAQKTGNNIKNYGQKAAWGVVSSTGLPGAFKQRYSDIKGGFDKGRENREARVASMLGSKDAMSSLERKRYEEDSKKMKNFNNSDLEIKAKTGNVAAADELLNRKSLNQEVYEEVIKNSSDIKRNDDLTAKFKGANKETRMDIVASIDARKNANNEVKIAPLVSGGLTKDQAMKKLLEDEIRSKFTKLNHNDFAKQDFEKIYTEIGNKLSKAPGTLEHHEGIAIRDSIYQAFHGLDSKAKAEVEKNISSSQTGALHSAGVI